MIPSSALLSLYPVSILSHEDTLCAKAFGTMDNDRSVTSLLCRLESVTRSLPNKSRRYSCLLSVSIVSFFPLSNGNPLMISILDFSHLAGILSLASCAIVVVVEDVASPPSSMISVACVVYLSSVLSSGVSFQS